MTTDLDPDRTAALTLSSFLGQAASPQSLRDALTGSGALAAAGSALSSLGTTTWAVVVDELSTAVASLLELDVGSIAFDAWSTAAELRAARHRTVLDGSREVVELRDTAVHLERTPAVEVSLASGPVLIRLDFSLCLTLDVPELACTVAHGRIVGLRTGECVLSTELCWHRHPLARRSDVVAPSWTVPVPRRRPA